MDIFFSQKKLLKGKVAWITGGKRIGKKIALSFAGAGTNIIMSYRGSRREADNVVARSKKLGVRAMAVQADVMSKTSVGSAVAEIKKSFAHINTLVNLASVFAPVKFEKIDTVDWSANVGTHIIGNFWIAQAAVPLMPSGSAIINIADRTSIGRVYPGYLPYTVTKSAIVGLTKSLAVELAPRGITVNAIAPGPVLRPAEISRAEWQRTRQLSRLHPPLSDTQAMDEFARLVVFLATQKAATGHVYPLDQGLNL